MEFPKEKRGHFLYRFFCPKRIFSRFVFYLNLLSLECNFRIYILLYIKKYYFIHFCCLFLKLMKAFSVSLSHFNLTWYFSANRWNSITFILRFEVATYRFILIFLSLWYWFSIVLVQSRFIVQSRFGSFGSFLAF